MNKNTAAQQALEQAQQEYDQLNRQLADLQAQEVENERQGVILYDMPGYQRQTNPDWEKSVSSVKSVRRAVQAMIFDTRKAIKQVEGDLLKLEAERKRGR